MNGFFSSGLPLSLRSRRQLLGLSVRQSCTPQGREKMALSEQPGIQQTMVVGFDGHREWSSGLCACCKDCGSGCCACWCMPCMLCKLATRMNECFLLPCLVPCALVPMRTKLRAVGDIKGSICQDFMAVSCCYPCAVCQMSRELDQMGV